MRNFAKINPYKMVYSFCPFTDVGKCRLRIFNMANMSFNAFRANKILAKIFDFTVLGHFLFTCIGFNPLTMNKLSDPYQLDESI